MQTGQTTSQHTIGVNALRFLSIDMVEQAKSGHPGLPLGAAPMAYTLFERVMRYDPARPDWFNRDRFVLSAGHGSALLYACLHVFGFDLGLEDLRQFRQLGSRTPGHPEFGLTPGVECTTGPLGQGFANGVGMAIAEAWLNERYGDIIDHFTYAIVSDGDLMEGLAQEAASLAGHLGLGKLVYLYDSNDICLDGKTVDTYTENVTTKFEAMGWHVLTVHDGNDVDAIETGVRAAQNETSRPSLVIVRTQIGYGSPLVGSSKVHGAPMGAENALKTRESLGWPHQEKFFLPAETHTLAESARRKGAELSSEWQSRFSQLPPHVQAEITAVSNKALPQGWDTDLTALQFPDQAATRDSGHAALNAVAAQVPWLVGGSADLSSSTKASVQNGGVFSRNDRSGRNILFGVREHAMGAIVNGLALHGLLPFGSTFLVFSDYMRGSVRLASLSGLGSLFIFSHDSVFVGEDGPTHQPIEHVESLRLIPGLDVYRPADAKETAATYRVAIGSQRAAAIVLTRQAVPTLGLAPAQVSEGVAKGGYVCLDPQDPEAVILATGSEVGLALAAASQSSRRIRVVSVPCRSLFERQTNDYRTSVLPPGIPVVAVEAGVTSGWKGWADATVGIDTFGESGPGQQVYDALGMTTDTLLQEVERLLAR